jgi:hypothetical protein
MRFERRTRLENLRAYVRSGYEHEAWYDNYDGLHFLGRKTTWASSMKEDYLDTEAFNPEGSNELGYTVGTSNADHLQPNLYYEIFIRSRLGNAVWDRGKVTGSRVHRPWWRTNCKKSWCMVQDQPVALVPAWEHPVAGITSWNNG